MILAVDGQSPFGVGYTHFPSVGFAVAEQHFTALHLNSVSQYPNNLPSSDLGLLGAFLQAEKVTIII